GRLQHPFVPLAFGKNKAGMQSAEEVSEGDAEAARQNWLVGREVAVIQAFIMAGGEEQVMKDAKGHEGAIAVCDWVRKMSTVYPDVLRSMKPLSVGVHKQHANRVLEPYAWHTVIVTGTAWRNFYALRASPMAQPEIQDLAIAMAQVHMESKPQELDHMEWHLPFVSDDDRDEVKEPRRLARLSSARCARVSYLTHDGKRSLDKDFFMADDLQKNGHMSPFEHPATTHDHTGAYLGSYNGNFSSAWMQYRKMIDGESDFSNHITRESLLQGLRGDERLLEFVQSLPE
ncbi:hypothetical protein KW785_03465, partial [Candidatus Parcubacteria bacterium]|nr:hypothetical protein [Candidatus Parcubacteria bacterium]